MSIPKVLFQTSRDRLEEHVEQKFRKHMNNDWQYLHFVDSEIIQFFEENYLSEFPDIVNKFNSIPTGAHKADLFRYYYLYVKGGVFVDSDAMITENIEEVTRDYSFFSVQGGGDGIFQGFIGCCPKNEIIYKALVDAYNIDLNLLANCYLLLCFNLHKIIHHNTYDFKYKLYYDKPLNESEYGIYDENDKLILIHYHLLKNIPK